MKSWANFLATKPLVGHPKWWFSKGRAPPKFPEFRFRNYCNLRRFCNIHTKLGGGFKYFFVFTPILREMIQFDKYFFKWGGSTTNEKNHLQGGGWWQRLLYWMQQSLHGLHGYSSGAQWNDATKIGVSWRWRFSTYHPRSRTINKGVVRPYQGKLMVNKPWS